MVYNNSHGQNNEKDGNFVNLTIIIAGYDIVLLHMFVVNLRMKVLSSALYHNKYVVVSYKPAIFHYGIVYILFKIYRMFKNCCATYRSI